MKLSALIGAAIVLFATTAFAYDLTYLSPIKAKETKAIKVDLPAGKLKVEVFSDDSDSKFNCQFTTIYGGIVFEQTNVVKCSVNVDVQNDTTMTATVTNLGKDTQAKIWVHNP